MFVTGYWNLIREVEKVVGCSNKFFTKKAKTTNDDILKHDIEFENGIRSIIIILFLKQIFIYTENY